jgi:hypothetical protein
VKTKRGNIMTGTFKNIIDGKMAEYAKPKGKNCHACNGDGHIEYDVYKQANFNRDIGYIDTQRKICVVCNGGGVDE